MKYWWVGNMEDADNRQNVYQYDWKWELLQTIKKYLLWALKIGGVLYILYLLLMHAPMWLISMCIGAIIFAIPSWIFIKKFFKIDYMVFLVVDLDKRELTPHFFPKKLINEGIWEICGTKSKYVSKSDIIKDDEIDKIYNECEKLEIAIGKLKEKKKKLKDELKVIRIKRKKRYFIKFEKAHYLFSKLGLHNLANIMNDDEKYYKTRLELEDKIKAIDYEIQDLTKEKNELLKALEWEGLEGDTIYIADKIDRKSKKIYLAPIHYASHLELQLNQLESDH